MTPIWLECGRIWPHAGTVFNGLGINPKISHNVLNKLIQFPDVSGAISREEVANFCNQQGYNGYGNQGSVYDYFFDNSQGMLQYTNNVVPYYTAAHPRSYYTNPAIPYGVRARELVKEALTHLQQQRFDFGSLSVDDENYIYAAI